jgi:hypothetical protein
LTHPVGNEVPAMSQSGSGRSERFPEEVRVAFDQLRDDVAMLRYKWSLYLELYSERETAALLSEIAPAFFQTIAESLRNDMIMTICRLSDPSRTLGGDVLSLATLVGQCDRVPNIAARLTAFQAAAGGVRRLRNRRLVHNDLMTTIVPSQDLLPGIDRFQVDEILRLATDILEAIYGHFCNESIALEPYVPGGVDRLLEWLKKGRVARE